MQRWKHGLAGAAAVALLLGMALTTPATVRAAPAAATDEAVVVESGDVRALVAPVALHPDPILALVLQASTLPLQVVQAERFLSRREKDPKLEPDPDWDKSIVGLLNYPGQLRSMSEYIDWTEELGNAVVDRLDEVQQEIQDIRLAAYDAGFLKSNERQKVEVKDDQVRITSTDAKKISIPQYDPAALLTALDEAEEAEEAGARRRKRWPRRRRRPHPRRHPQPSRRRRWRVRPHPRSTPAPWHRRRPPPSCRLKR